MASESTKAIGSLDPNLLFEEEKKPNLVGAVLREMERLGKAASSAVNNLRGNTRSSVSTNLSEPAKPPATEPPATDLRAHYGLTDEKIATLTNILGGNARCNYIIPSGNPTLLLEGDEYSPENVAAFAREIVNAAIVEQVGVITGKQGYADNSLYMMNGEFCGNAVHCLAAIMHAREPQTNVVHIQCSGRENPVECRCEDAFASNGKNANMIRVESILEGENPSKKELRDGITLIHLEGISHFLVPVASPKDLENFGPQNLDRLIAEFCKGEDAPPAIGGIFYAQDERGLRTKPIVHALSSVEESGCASGSAALAIKQYMDNEQQSRLQIIQPSGEKYVAEVSTNPDDNSLLDVKIANTVIVERDAMQ